MAAVTVTALLATGLLSFGSGAPALYLLLAVLVGLYGSALGLATLVRIAVIADAVAVILVVASLFAR